MRHAIHDHRFWLAAILAAYLAVGSVYAAAVPLFESPDEIWHYAFADHLAGGGGLPVFSATKSDFLREGGQPPLYYAAVALALLPFDRSDFPGFVRFNASHPNVTRGATSDTPNVFVHTEHEDWPWKGSVLAVHVGRLVSLVFGVLTILGVYAAGRTAIGDAGLALAGAALVAFIPQFLYMSSSVNNDGLMAAAGTWTGVAALQMIHLGDPGQSPRWRKALWLGFWLGVGMLSKLSAVVLIPLAILALVIRACRARPFEKSVVRNLLLESLAVFGVAAVLSGWWYARNLILYGDPLGWNVWLSDIGVRSPTPAVWQLLPEFPALFRSFWADFGGLQFSGVIYLALATVCLAAIAGILRSLFIQRSPDNREIRDLRFDISDLKFETWNLIFALLWFAIVLAGVVRYMQTTPAAQGRLLFPALAPIGLLLAWGLASLTRRRWPAPALAVCLFLLSAAAPFALIRPAFARPLVARLPAGTQPAEARFGDIVELVGARFSASVAPGGMLRVTTYWRAQQPIARDQRLLLRLMRPDGQSAGQLDAMLGTNLYPATLWQPGQMIADTHDIRADADLPVGLALHVHIGVGDEIEPLLPVTGRMAWPTGDVADAGQVKVTR